VTNLTGDRRSVIHVRDEDEDFDSRVIQVARETDLMQHLGRLKHQNRLPVIICIDSNAKALGGSGSGKGGGHVVSITDIDEAKGQIKISNQWGKKYDRWSTIHELLPGMNR